MLWSEIEAFARRLGTQTTLVLREEVQKAILSALAQKGCFERVVFQGGTALRLFHGNPRLSEDIDLVIDGSDSEIAEGMEFDLAGYLPGIEHLVLDTFPFINTAEIKTQKHDNDLQRYILVINSNYLERKLRIHIELAAIPSYRNRPMILDFPPFHPAVRVEEVDEILADKICALALRPYLKGRDLWDIHFLARERAVDVDWDLIRRKTFDYGKSLSRLNNGFKTAIEKIGDEGSAILQNEMERFLPRQVLEAYGGSLNSILNLVLDVISIHDVKTRETP